MVGQLRWTPEARQPTQQLTEVKEEISLSGLNPCPDEEGIKTTHWTCFCASFFV